ncbi:MAG: aminoglycoside phosphotransferase [Myxococcales bacterium]|nr:MAG: aminoglycoside phosphotransferase [Myxococcales bacterium]
MEFVQQLKPYVAKIAGRPDPVYEVVKLAGDASNRQYFRIRLTDGSAPPTLVAMVFNPADALRSEEAAGDSLPARLPFLDVGRYLQRGGVRVPDVYLEDVPKGFIFLEDVGDRQLFALVHEAGEEARRGWYRRAIDTLVGFQTLTRTRPEPACPAFTREFTHDLLMWEFDHYLEWGVEALYDRRIPEDDRTAFHSHFDRICRSLRKLPQVVVHRDYQSRNLMVHRDELVVIDFQDALWGPVPYDLVALLRDSYVALDEALVDDLVDYYIARAVPEKQGELTREGFRRGFLLQTVQRKLKDAGRFVFIDRVKKNPSFLPNIPTSLGYVRWALARLPEYGELGALLARYEERLAP